MQTTATQCGLRYCIVCNTKTFLLFWFTNECTHDADTGELLAENFINTVDALLHLAERGNHAGNDDAEQDSQDGNRHHQDARQTEILMHRHEDATDCRERSTEDQGARHQHKHLHLLHIVCDASDQRRRTEDSHFSCGEVVHLMEKLTAHIPTESHRHF